MSRNKPKTHVDVNVFIEKARRDYEDSVKGSSDYPAEVESAVDFVEVVRCQLCTQHPEEPDQDRSAWGALHFLRLRHKQA